MALQPIGRVTAVPEYISTIGAPGFNNGMLLDGANEKAEFIVQAPATGNIRRVIYGIGNMTTSDSVDVRIETVNKTVSPAVPSGTLWGTNTNGADSALIANSIRTITLAADAAVTVSDDIAIVINNNATGNFTVRCLNYNNIRYPYTFLNAPAGTRTIREFPPVLALEYSDGTIYPVLGGYPILAITNNNFNNASTPDERGMRFQVPFACRVVGLWWIGTLSSGGTFAARILNDDGTVRLQKTGIDTDVWYASGSNGSHQMLLGGSTDLAAGTWYRATLLPETTTNIGLTDFDVSAAGHMAAFELGTNCYYTERTDGGAFTNTVTKRPYMGLLISHLDDAAGSGGSVIVTDY